MFAHVHRYSPSFVSPNSVSNMIMKHITEIHIEEINYF